MFIRTETGIYDLELKDNKDINYYQINDDFEEETYGGKTGRVLYIPSKAVLKQSNDPAELCDGIIMTYTEYQTEYYVYEELDDIPLLDLKCKNKYFNIYGFIETDKGLIYVAKMNENGKLVLI